MISGAKRVLLTDGDLKPLYYEFPGVVGIVGKKKDCSIRIKQQQACEADTSYLL